MKFWEQFYTLVHDHTGVQEALQDGFYVTRDVTRDEMVLIIVSASLPAGCQQPRVHRLGVFVGYRYAGHNYILDLSDR